MMNGEGHYAHTTHTLTCKDGIMVVCVFMCVFMCV